MGPSENKLNLELPAPVMESGSAAAGQAPERTTGSAEQAPAGAEQAAATGQAAAAGLPVFSLPAGPATPPTAPQSNVITTTQAATPLPADDGDLIEKEWVNRAKKIVEATRDDPYKQSEELTVVKADYMQKRYNKAIKLNK